jgi:shikimate dehydrogenase
MNITSKTKICMVIGDPIEHSLGPQKYNDIYQRLGIDDQFVYVACRVKISDVADFIKGVRAMGIRGVSCTIPHKVEVMKYLDKIDPVAGKIGAVNTIVNDDGFLTGYNTDWTGAVIPLERVTPLKGKTVALIGAGGAARAIAYGVSERGAKLVIYNRTPEKANELAEAVGASSGSLDNLDDIKGMDIIINATSVGMQPNNDETPLPKQYITAKHVVLDAVYTPYETRLLRESAQQGAKVIHGTEMLLHQGLDQFKLYTGHEVPEDMMRQVLDKYLPPQEAHS